MPNRLRRAVCQTALGLSWLLAAVQHASAALGGMPMTPPAGASTMSRLVTVPGSASSSTLGVAHTGSEASGVTGASGASGATGASGAASTYTVLETTLSSGTVVREYLAQNGTVFGIAWHGPKMPDLTDLLGSFFPQYLSGVHAVRAMRGGHGPVSVEQTGLVVHSGGHMGSFGGEAWLPQALPAGVSGADIQ